MVKTMDLMGFTLMLARNSSADLGPCNRKFQDCQDGNILEWGRQPTLRVTWQIQSLWVNP